MNVTYKKDGFILTDLEKSANPVILINVKNYLSNTLIILRITFLL